MSASLLTVEEWAELDEDDSRELVNGVLEDSEVPDVTHETVVWWLAQLLGYFRARGGWAGVSGLKLGLAADRGRLGDVVCYEKPPPPRGVVRVPPTLIVEVISPGKKNRRRDRFDKVADYAAFGVRFYWLVDPELRTVEILELGREGKYVHALGASEGRLENVPGCPDLIVDLDELWAELDRLGSGS